MVLHLNTWNHYRLSGVRIATAIFVQAPYAMAVSVYVFHSHDGVIRCSLTFTPQQ